jgi:hypothetical protein
VQRGFGYVWMGDALGGKAEGGVEAKLATDQGEAALRQVVHLAAGGGGGNFRDASDEGRRWAMMCSEGKYTECHRCKIAARIAGGGGGGAAGGPVRVTHIAPDGTTEDHPRPIAGFFQRQQQQQQRQHQQQQRQHQQQQEQQQQQRQHAPSVEGGDAAAAAARKRRNKETVRRLKALLSDEATYAEFRAFSHQFQTGETSVGGFLETGLGFLGGDAGLLGDLVGLLPPSPQRDGLLAELVAVQDMNRRDTPGSGSGSGGGGGGGGVWGGNMPFGVVGGGRGGGGGGGLRDNAATTATTATGDGGDGSSATVSAFSSAASVTVVALAFHHILDEGKREALLDWGIELNLGKGR